MITVRHLTKHFGRTVAVDGISFDVREGEVTGFLGPNGSGKSTTFKMLCGYLEPTAGQASIAGYDVQENPLEVKKRIGYLQETPTLYKEMQVRPYLRFVTSLKGIKHSLRRSKIDAVISTCGLQEIIKKNLGAVSKGYRQRVALAQALLGDPPVLLLDEPTSGLDPLQAVEIRNLIRSLAKKRTVLLSTHILPEATACCDRAMIISRGKIMAEGPIGSLQKGLSQEKVIVLRFTRLNPEILKELEKIKHIGALRSVEASCVEVKTTAPEEMRAQIFKKAAQNQWPLEEIFVKKEDLEKIFMEVADK